MASALDSILDLVKRKVAERTGGQDARSPGGILGQIVDAIGQRAKPTNKPGQVRPASADPYGDPADQAGGTARVKPASQDPYGDPADSKR